MTTSPPVVIERRIGQRFSFNLPVFLRDVETTAEGLGFTQDLSSRGAFLFTDMALREGAAVELTLKMPSEITLGDAMPVRCRGRVLRVMKSEEAAETKIGVAVCLSAYEYLSDGDESTAEFRRISALHTHAEVPGRAS